jgi:hypothetical protein
MRSRCDMRFWKSYSKYGIGIWKGFPRSYRTQDLDIYCRGYGEQNNLFHLRAISATQNTSSNIFL